MAQIEHRLPENVPGEFFVDATCIDCDACRQIAPATFRDHGGQSSVHAQPHTASTTRRALMALVACPTASIGTASRLNARAAVQAFPEPIVDTVYFCGFTAEASFGAWSYLIRRDERRGGNVLVDSPRFTAPWSASSSGWEVSASWCSPTATTWPTTPSSRRTFDVRG